MFVGMTFCGSAAMNAVREIGVKIDTVAGAAGWP